MTATPTTTTALLPNEPRVSDPATQAALTDRYLTPALHEIEALFRHIRSLVDEELKDAPTGYGKPYPIGRCLEITLAAQKKLRGLDPSMLPTEAAHGLNVLHGFLQHGGNARQVWGDLRGEFFQNAFLIGTLYIDVSNDTVTPTKPKVEILPFEQAGFVPVRDYLHYARMTRQYWGAYVFANHILPDLAPYFPLITAIPGGRVRLESDFDYMLALTQSRRFEPSLEVLTAQPMEAHFFDAFRGAVLDLPGVTVASTPAEGRALALEYCRQFQMEDRQHGDKLERAATQAANEANQRLGALNVKRRESKV